MNPTQGNAGKPVAVLAGWLGCRPRNLRRFSRMYDRHGWATLTSTGSPESVVKAMTEGPSPGRGSRSGMCRLAVDTLRELRAISPPRFVLHVFSNGGCFLWEWIRFLLFERATSPSPADPDFRDLGRRLVGVAFDSAPAHYGGRRDALRSALQHVSPATERNRLLAAAESLDEKVTRRRFGVFWAGLRDDATGVPQMYLYGRSDPLAPAGEMEALIARRQEVAGRDRIMAHEFSDSGHCRHLLKYPNEYDRLVEQFLRLCTSRVHVVREDDDAFNRSRL